MKIFAIIALILIVVAIYEWGTISSLIGLRYPKVASRRKNKARDQSESSAAEAEDIKMPYLPSNKTRLLANREAQAQAGKSETDSGSMGTLSALIKSQSYNRQKGSRSQEQPTRASGGAENAAPEQAQAEVIVKERLDAKIITPAEMALLIKSTGEKWQALMTLACYSGMRDIELFGLFWEDVDFEKSTIKVERAYTDSKFSDPEPGALKRTVVLPPAVIKSLRKYKAYLKEKGIPADHTLIFLGSPGKGLNENLLKNIFETAVGESSLKARDIRFEDIRYSYAWALLNAGESPEFIHRQLGYPTALNKIKSLEPFPPGFEAAKAKQLASVWPVVVIS